jgi:hypothetical protein
MSDLVERDAHGRFLPGNGGRPAGRTELERIRALVQPHRDEVVATLVAAAKAGDVKAAELLLERLAAKPRPQAERVMVPGLREQTTLKGKADAVIAAVAQGEISAEAGSSILRMITDYARAITVDDHEARLQHLERGERVINPDPAGELV